MAGDPHWDKVVLAMHMDGANASTVFTDVKGHVVTPVNGAQISTAQSKFGGASGRLTIAPKSYLSINNSADFDFASGDFTIETFIHFISTGTAGGAIFGRWSAFSSAGADFILAIANNKLFFWVGAAAAVSLSDPVNLGTASQIHVAVTRLGNIWTLWKAGQAVATTTLAQAVPYTSAQPIRFGIWDDVNSSLDAYLDDVLITKGVARYTANFTPPAAAFLDYAAQLTGTVKDDANTLCARTVRAYRRSNGALVGSVVSNAVTGAYSINTQTTDAHTVIVLDDDAGTQYNALVLDKVMPI